MELLQRLIRVFNAPKKEIEWWGYQTKDNTYKAFKRYDIRDLYLVKQSEYCKQIVYPFLATNKQQALTIIKTQTNNEKGTTVN